MADYKNIPVDQETYDMLVALCDAYERKQGAQVKALVKVEYEKWASVKLIAQSAPRTAPVVDGDSKVNSAASNKTSKKKVS